MNDVEQSPAKNKKLDRIHKRFKYAEDWESRARVLARDDDRFAEADPDHPTWQWPDQIYQTRTAPGEGQRPCIVVNKVRQHNLQIINDGRENKPSVTVHAMGFGASAEAAQVYEGIIRHIEYQSKASAVYVSASKNQVKSGVGYWRVVTEYPTDDSFDQEIYLRRVIDPNSVYMDPDAQEVDKSDARWGIIFRDMPRDLFELEYPKYKDLAGAQSMEGERKGSGWTDKDMVRVAEYYERTEMTDVLWAVPENTVHDGHPGGLLRESDMKIDGLADALAQHEKAGTPGVQSRPIENTKVSWSLVVGHEIVEEQDTAYNTIPIVTLLGEEIVVDGVLDRRGHTRALKDAQRMYNYNASASIEFGALQSMVPWLVDLRSIEGYETEWASANTKRHAYLPYNSLDDTGQPTLPQPERIQPPAAAPIYMEAMQVAEQQMMIASGQYQAQMGAESNERTGIAIQERQRQGDKATYHFIDNLGIAIAYTGRILVDLIPKVYDTKRVQMIMGEDGSMTQVHIDPDHAQAHSVVAQPGQPQPGAQSPDDTGALDTTIIFNPAIGKYSVEAEMGPAFATRREEEANAWTQLMTASPEVAANYLDLYFGSQDWPGADEAQQRAHALLPPQAKGGPSPQEQQMQQVIQHLTQQLQQKDQVLQQSIKELGDEKAKSKLANDNKIGNMTIDQYRAETDRMEALHDINPDLMRPLVSQLVLEALHAANGGIPGVVTSVLPHPNAPPTPPPAPANSQANPQQGDAA